VQVHVAEQVDESFEPKNEPLLVRLNEEGRKRRHERPAEYNYLLCLRGLSVRRGKNGDTLKLTLARGNYRDCISTNLAPDWWPKVRHSKYQDANAMRYMETHPDAELGHKELTNRSVFRRG